MKTEQGPKPVYVPKDHVIAGKPLYPYFGYFDDAADTLYIREDLPYCVKMFVLDHEYKYFKDSTRPDVQQQGWLKREERANIEAFRRHPWGAIRAVILSINWTRFKLYIERWQTKK